MRSRLNPCEGYNKILYPLVTSLFFAGSFVAAKYAVLELEPFTTTLLRYIVALIFLTTLTSNHKLASLSIAKADLIPLILLGLFGIVGYHYFFFVSLRFTEVTNTAIINALNPIATGFAAKLLINEQLSRRNYLGVTIVFAGVIFLIAKGNVSNILRLQFNHGDLLMLLAVSSWVAYSLLIKNLLKKHTSFTLTYYATLFGVILLLPLTLSEGCVQQIQTISPSVILAILYMGIFASGIGYLFYNLSIKEIGATKTASFVYSLVPVFVAVLALLFFNESITGMMVLSAGLIVFGLHFMIHKRK